MYAKLALSKLFYKAHNTILGMQKMLHYVHKSKIVGRADEYNLNFAFSEPE